MIISPSIDQVLAGVIMAIDDEILPAVTNPKAYATAQMMQSLLQGVRQALPVIEAQLVDEHNDMIRTLVAAGAALGDAEGEAADRVRERAATLGQWRDLPAPVDREAMANAHAELGRAIEACFTDLDELQRSGVESADHALDAIRTHLAQRFIRDVATFCVGEGFVGRG